MRKNHKNVAIVLLGAILYSISFVAPAVAKNWNTTNGNWNTAANWSPASVPVASEQVNIVNSDGVARTVTLDVNTPSLGLVTINQTSGTAVNTLSIPTNNTFTSSALFVGGWTGGSGGTTTNGRGAVTQSNGSLTMASGTDLVVGYGAGSIGTYTLSGTGAVTASQSEFIGSLGSGTFIQSAGTNTLTASAVGYLNMGTSAGATGTYILSGGSLVANKNEVVGDAGTGIFNQTGGTNTIQGAGHDLQLGNQATGNGTYTLSNSAILNVGNNVAIGVSGTGTLNIQGTSTVSVANAVNINPSSFVYINGGTLRLNSTNAPGRIFFNSGKLQLGGSRTIGSDPIVSAQFGTTPIIPIGKELAVEGDATVATPLTINGGKLSTSNYVILGSSGSPTTVNVTNGGVLSPRYMWPIDYGSTLNVTGPGSSVTNDPNDHFSVGFNNSDGFMNITAGGSVTTGVTGYVGNSNVGGGTGKGTVVVSGAGSKWTTGWALAVGDQAPGLLTIQDQALVYTGPAGTSVFDLGTLNLNGGTLRTTDIQVFGSGKFNFNSGTIILAYDRTVGSDPTIATYFGASPVLQAGKGLGIEGIATLVTPVVIDGGTLSVGQLATPANLGMNHGTLNITGQFVTVGPGGTFNALDLNTGMTVNVTVGTTNQGLITGDGELGGTLTNAATGELRGEPGKSLKLTGANNTNAGQINLFGGMVEFRQNLTNSSGAFISGNGTLKVGTLLTNNGTMNFSGLANIVGDVTNNVGAKIISSGGGPTTFHDDVINNGEIRTSAGSFTTFFGATSGGGTYTGTGTVNFEGDLKPGNSPAAISFGGNMALGVDSSLKMELGGLAAGSQYDQVAVAGNITLDGVLQILLISGFTPSAGNSFDLLNWGSLSGTFSSLELPALNSGLTWNTSQLYTTGVISVASASIPGDYNNNGIVDAGDYVQWRKTDGTSGGYNTWRAHFGEMASGSGTVAIAAVPEPATLVLLLLSAAGAWLGRRSGA